MAKRVPKASKRRLVFLTPFILLITVYFLFTVGYYGFKLISLKNEQIHLSNNLMHLQAEEKDLKNEIQKLKDPDYLARYAREHFLYSKDGEYIIRFDKNDDVASQNFQIFDWIEENFWYIISGFSLIICLFIGFIFKKNHQKSSHS